MNPDPEPLDTREAFRAESPWFGALLCPAAQIVEETPDVAEALTLAAAEAA